MYLLDRLRLTIKDNGKGIDSSAIEKIKQAGVTLGKQGGTGLGLTYALKKVDEWNWRYTLQSELGKFTKIAFFIPLVKQPSWFSNKLTLDIKEFQCVNW